MTRVSGSPAVCRYNSCPRTGLTGTNGTPWILMAPVHAPAASTATSARTSMPDPSAIHSGPSWRSETTCTGLNRAPRADAASQMASVNACAPTTPCSWTMSPPRAPSASAGSTRRRSPPGIQSQATPFAPIHMPLVCSRLASSSRNATCTLPLRLYSNGSDSACRSERTRATNSSYRASDRTLRSSMGPRLCDSTYGTSMPPEACVAPCARPRSASSSTRHWRRASSYAIAQPMTPPPTMRTRGAMRRVYNLRAMAGYSGTPLPKKLEIKEGTHVALVGAPADFAKALGKLPPGATLRRGASGTHVGRVAEEIFRHEIRSHRRRPARSRPADWNGGPEGVRGGRDLVGPLVFLAKEVTLRRLAAA